MSAARKGVAEDAKGYRAFHDLMWSILFASVLLWAAMKIDDRDAEIYVLERSLAAVQEACK